MIKTNKKILIVIGIMVVGAVLITGWFIVLDDCQRCAIQKIGCFGCCDKVCYPDYPWNLTEKITKEQAIAIANDPEALNGYNLTIENNTISVTIINYTNVTVETPQGNRTLLEIPGAYLLSHHMEYIIPEIVVTTKIPSDRDIKDLNISMSDKITLTYIELPVTDQRPMFVSESYYLGYEMNLSKLYPGEFVEYEIVEKIREDNTLVFRIFPFQYNGHGCRCCRY